MEKELRMHCRKRKLHLDAMLEGMCLVDDVDLGKCSDPIDQWLVNGNLAQGGLKKVRVGKSESGKR